MESSSQLNKKGLSEMVSYVLLVAIAISISVGVAVYLNLYIPKEKPECPPDTSLLIKDASCIAYYDSSNRPSKTELSFTLYNNGLHSIDASYVRFDKEERKSRKWINNPSNPSVGEENFYFYDPQAKEPGLSPGSEKKYSFQLSNFDEGSYTLETQPAIFSDNILSACSNIITQDLECRRETLTP